MVSSTTKPPQLIKLMPPILPEHICLCFLSSHYVFLSVIVFCFRFHLRHITIHSFPPSTNLLITHNLHFNVMYKCFLYRYVENVFA